MADQYVGAPPAPQGFLGRPLWHQGDLLRWGLVVGVALVMCIVGWYLASEDATMGKQIGPANLAVGGLIVAGVGHVSWLLSGRRAVGERRRVLLGEPAAATVSVSEDVDVTREMSVPGGADDLIAGEGLRYYHRADCTLAGSRDWPSAGRGEMEAAGRQPCGVCRP